MCMYISFLVFDCYFCYLLDGLPEHWYRMKAFDSAAEFGENDVQEYW